MACSSSTTKQDLRQMKSFEKEDILTQSAKNVRSFQERTMGPEDVELTDNENSFEENFSCDDDDDNNIDTDEYDEDEDKHGGGKDGDEEANGGGDTITKGKLAKMR